jgi:hypothetical protein
VYAGSIDGTTKKFLVRSDGTALYAPPGWLLFRDGDALQAQAFDAKRLELSGQLFTIAAGVGHASNGFTGVSVSNTGTLAYSSYFLQPGRLEWWSRRGDSLAMAMPDGDYTDFRLSPDERRLAVSLVDPKTGNPDIWLKDLARGGTQRFTSGPTLNASPVWSPDGTLIIFRTNRNGGFVDLYQKSSAGGGDEDQVLRKELQLEAGGLTFNIFLADWSSDGRLLVYSATGSFGSELWLLQILGDRKPANLLRSLYQLMHPNFSPDARLVAYTSSESGKYEVWAETVPRSDKKRQISISGGYEPRWRADGRELYYLSEDRKLMEVSVGPNFFFGTPRPLFQTRVPEGVRAFRTHYVPSRDGQRFLVNAETATPAPTQITVVQNWDAGLKK